MPEHFIEMSDISLSFDGHQVIKHADFYLDKGEICSILGENSVGKSALMKILAGMLPADNGTIRIDGCDISDRDISEMQKSEVYMIQDTFQLIDFFTVEENLFIGIEQNRRHIPLIDKKYQLQHAQKILHALECPVSPSQRVGDLTIELKTIVEIAKAVSRNAKVLIFDKTTAAMTPSETDTIFSTLRKLADSGMAIVFISHELDDILRYSDRVVIMRNGTIIDNQMLSSSDNSSLYDSLLTKMAGRSHLNRYPKTNAPKDELLLELRDAHSYNDMVKKASLYIRRGEIIGIAGLQGAGKTSLIRILAGIEKLQSGTLKLAYKKSELYASKLKKRKQIETVLLSADNSENIIADHSILKNVTLPSLASFQRGPFLNIRKCYYHTKNVLNKYGINDTTPTTKAKFLSSGTQQKIAIARLMNMHPDIFLMDEPSNNLDFSSKVELFNIMNTLASRGTAIVFTSSDISELIGMCDRLYIMFRGTIVAELGADEANSVNVLSYATGKSS